ncbi:hypothetical protein OQA88_9318 [Cercophora sp. LCS_1]
MKKLFQKIGRKGGKRGEESQQQQPSQPASQPSPPQAKPPPQHPQPPEIPQHQFESQNEASQDEEPPQATTSERHATQSLRILCSDSLNVSGMDTLLPVLQQPASKFAEANPGEFVQFMSPSLCPVCFNLDPFRVPPERNLEKRGQSWARLEFKIPADAPAVHIRIDKGTDLVESSQGGCLTCNMVATALSGLAPGWEQKKAFIHLFWAPDLPLVVRIEIGATASVSMGPEEALGLGMVLPEGQSLVFDIIVSTKDEEWGTDSVEVEIYRPSVVQEEATVGGELIKHVGVASDNSSHAGSHDSFVFIREQIENCLYNHQCSHSPSLTPLPDRVIWLKSPHSPSGIQLIEPQGSILAPYVALSYCWGPVSPTTFLTSQETLAARKAGINYEDLPPLFQDVVTVCRTLGFQYLWIDRLCIIQGVRGDFLRQAPKMGDIYGNAILTIASASATTENDRILAQRDPKWEPMSLQISANGMGTLRFSIRHRSHRLGSESKGGDYGRISTRAWTWQERMLSARTLFFAPSALKFECRTHAIWEGFGPGVAGHSWSAQLEDITFRSWLDLVEEFTKRDITNENDRRPAMDAVMERLGRITGRRWIWGLWQDSMLESLCWQGDAKDKAGKKVPCKMYYDFYAPTWSWFSVVGPVSYSSGKGYLGTQTDPIIHELQVKDFNRELAVLTVESHVLTCEMHCEVKEESDEGPGGEKRLVYTYSIVGLSPTGPIPIIADVHLKPWTGLVHGQTFSTVHRSHDGERTSWISNCLCLLVTRQSLRSTVLFLGQSKRVSGAWERLSMVDAPDPAPFLATEKQVLRLA